MKNLIKYIAVLSLLLLNFNASAQYERLTKGERSTFDSSINIQLSTYRVWRVKLLVGDSLIAGFKNECDSMRIELDKFNVLTTAQVHEINAITGFVTRERSNYDSLNTKFDSLIMVVSKQKPFYEQPLFIAISCFLLGIFIAK